jgi:hypothetical protein
MTKLLINKYIKQNPKRAQIIKKAVRRGLKDYALTFKKLAAT